MSSPDQQRKDRKQGLLNATLAILAGQVGCLTLVIIIAALLSGMWLDNHFQTRPLYTVILLIVSVPFSIVAMVFLARAAVNKIKVQSSKSTKSIGKKEEPNFGSEEDE